MRIDIDYLINLMERYTTKTVSELGEADTEAPSGGSTGGGSKNNVTTWAGTVGASLNRSGPANPISNQLFMKQLRRRFEKFCKSPPNLCCQNQTFAIK